MAGSGSERAISEWLPVVPELTVMGRLEFGEEGAMIVPDRKEGLFFSPGTPAQAGRWELMKGWGGIAAAVVLTAVLLAIFASVLE